MGLDMYAWRIKPEKLALPTKIDPAFNTPNAEDNVEKLEYWRKFNNLHGWMEDLYLESGGTREFNCEKLRLDPEDLDRLEQDAETLQPRGGFFFGTMEPMTPEDVEEVKSFVRKAREAIAAGDFVYYDSWW